jgi:hypothetical protein
MITTLQDNSGYYLSIIENGQTFNFNYIIPNDLTSLIEIKYQNMTINYFLNGTLLRSIPKTNRNKLYLNIFTYYANQYINNIIYRSLKEYYIGGNGFYCDGFQGSDSISDLSGSIIYSGTSQGATNAGTYTIIPSGFTSKNYNITYVTGKLIIKKSLQT